MRLHDQHVKRFQDLYQAEYGIRLSEEEARELATSLVELISSLIEQRPNGYGQRNSLR
jgi:hypothetical protein